MNATAIEGIPRVTTPAVLMTAEELLAYPMPDKRIDLVRGRLVVREPPGLRHGECSLRIGVALSNFLNRDRVTTGATRARGRVVTGDAGFTLTRSPDTVRGPDVAYVSYERWSGPMPDGYGEFAPDLAVEVRSPHDRPGEVLAKVGDWLEAGTQVVWVVDVIRRQVLVYHADGAQSMLGVGDTLTGDDMLPGFAYAIAELFDG